MISVLGIRHHGPGSTKSMLKALESLQPDAILIEGPPDANTEIAYVANSKLIPPVALLVYNPKDLGQAAYYPFASFSPEWQAMRFGLRKNIPLRFMDLPQSMHFGLNNMAKEQKQIALETFMNSGKPLTKKEKFMQLDPMAYAAKASGFTDSERWWELMFERHENPEEIFPAILALIKSMREGLPFKSLREQQREAYMRKTIRETIKEGYKNIAIVCGAWHAPALESYQQHPIKTDNALLKGIKKIKTKATWVPWTFERLSTRSGYGSGVISPAYYQLLFEKRAELLPYWMTKVAQLFRKEDLDASAAHVIEAVRLAESLSILRELPVPGLDEMYEAAVSIFCEGYAEKMDIIEKELIIGKVMGKVPKNIPVIPFQQDLEKQIRSARIFKEYEQGLEFEKNLDLRTNSHLLLSKLLHRLNLLGIPFGTHSKVFKDRGGSFHEHWAIHWQPDFAILVIEAGMWGNTVYSAAENICISKAPDIKVLQEMTALLESALQADLPEAVKQLVQYLKDLSTLTKDVEHLMEALPPLVDALRYGTARKLDVYSIEQVIDQIVPRICIGLPNACIALDEEASKEIFKNIKAVNGKLNVLNNPDYLKLWYDAIHKITRASSINGLLRGGTTRLLFDKEYIDLDDIVTQMRYALSPANAAIDSAHWIEGFLDGSGLLLIYQPALWNILDEWVDDLKEENFKQLLPILRRTFSAFSGPERQKMMDLAKRGQISTSENDSGGQINQERATAILPTVKMLLGIK